MILLSFLHHFPYSVHKENGLGHLFASNVFRQVAMTLLGLFSPIYIYETLIAHDFSKLLSINLVLLFFIFLTIFKLVSLSLAENLSQKIGFKGTIWLSVIPFAVFLIGIMLSSKFVSLFLLVAIIWGMHEGLFWWGYHGFFIKSSKDGHLGKKLGTADFLYTLAVVLTPLLGALIITLYGFDSIFIAAAFFVFLSLVALGRSEDKKQHNDVRFWEIVKLVNKHKAVGLAYAGRGGEYQIYAIVWPLFLYFVFGRVLDLGAIVSLAAFIASLFAIVIGSGVDRRGEQWAIKLGVPLIVISWVLRFAGFISAFVAADSIRNFGQKLITVPLDELSYKKAIEGGTGAALLFREIGIVVGQIVALLAVVLVVNISTDFSLNFLVAAMFGLLPIISIIEKKI